ncbi:hypothetical protein JW960_28455 [candidate division KSB1 bacterium]|nr:hypothetical protein [candidate division KSB1 bacterium]
MNLNFLCKISIIFIVVKVLWPESLFAYVGPGTGMSAIGSFLALVASVIIAILGFIWYPIKRLLGKKVIEPDQIKDTDKK